MGYQPMSAPANKEKHARIRSEILETAYREECARMERIDAKCEVFWASVHEFWRRYDAGEAQPLAPLDTSSFHCVNDSTDVVPMLVEVSEARAVACQERGAPPRGGSAVIRQWGNNTPRDGVYPQKPPATAPPPSPPKQGHSGFWVTQYPAHLLNAEPPKNCD